MPRARATAAAVAIALPAAAILIYLQASNWDWDAPPPAPAITAPDLQRIVAQLQEKCRRQPEDVEGWKLLGRSATVLGDYALARDAFGEAYTRTRGSRRRGGRRLRGVARAGRRAGDRRRRQPSSSSRRSRSRRTIRARSGTAESPPTGAAISRWPGNAGSSCSSTTCRRTCARCWRSGSRSSSKPQGRPATPTVAGAVPTQPPSRSRLRLMPALAARVPPNATLFVIARRGEGGPPLAVQRRPVGAWPVVGPTERRRRHAARASRSRAAARSRSLRGSPRAGSRSLRAATCSERSVMISPRPVRRASR